jgi:iron-sulfur cluster assembly accessory protein
LRRKTNSWDAALRCLHHAARRSYRFDLGTRQPYFSGMINVTDSAVRQLQSLLSQRAENSRKGLRVQVAKGGCSGLHYEMTLDERKDGDAVVERNGMKFFIDGDSVPYLRDATLDFSDGLTGTGFQVVNPNASRTCGCGSSFETTQSA